MDRQAVVVYPFGLRLRDSLITRAYTDSMYMSFLILPTVLQIDVRFCFVVDTLLFLRLSHPLGVPHPVFVGNLCFIVVYQCSRALGERHAEVDVLIGVFGGGDRFNSPSCEERTGGEHLYVDYSEDLDIQHRYIQSAAGSAFLTRLGSNGDSGFLYANDVGIDIAAAPRTTRLAIFVGTILANSVGGSDAIEHFRFPSKKF